MALIKCPACEKQISDQAAACPHCGHPMARPAASNKANPATGCLGLVGIFVLVLIVIGMMSGGNDSKTTSRVNEPGKQTQVDLCRSDWTKCADNAQLVNNYSKWYSVQSACKIEAEDRAKYGTPKWFWFAFGHFLKGTDYVSRGVATAIEPDAQFQNGFGAMVQLY